MLSVFSIFDFPPHSPNCIHTENGINRHIFRHSLKTKYIRKLVHATTKNGQNDPNGPTSINSTEGGRGGEGEGEGEGRGEGRGEERLAQLALLHSHSLPDSSSFFRLSGEMLVPKATHRIMTSRITFYQSPTCKHRRTCDIVSACSGYSEEHAFFLENHWPWKSPTMQRYPSIQRALCWAVISGQSRQKRWKVICSYLWYFLYVQCWLFYRVAKASSMIWQKCFYLWFSWYATFFAISAFPYFFFFSIKMFLIFNTLTKRLRQSTAPHTYQHFTCSPEEKCCRPRVWNAFLNRWDAVSSQSLCFLVCCLNSSDRRQNLFLIRGDKPFLNPKLIDELQT